MAGGAAYCRCSPCPCRSPCRCRCRSPCRSRSSGASWACPCSLPAWGSVYRSPVTWARCSAHRSPAGSAGWRRAAWGTGAPGRSASPRPGRFRRSGRSRPDRPCPGRPGRGRLPAPGGRRADDDVGEPLDRCGQRLGVGGGGERADDEYRGGGGHGGGGPGRQEWEERAPFAAAGPGGRARHAVPVPVRRQRRALVGQFVVGGRRRQRRQDFRNRLHLGRRPGVTRPRRAVARARHRSAGSSRRVGRGKFGMSPSGTSRPVTALHPPRPVSGRAAAGLGGRPP